MANQLDAKDDLKTQFITREGTYRLLTLSEYSRPNRVGYTNSQNSPQVRVSIVSLPNPSSNNGGGSQGPSGNNTTANGTVSNGANSSSANGINQAESVFSVPTSMEARLGAGMSMHSMMNGAGGLPGLDGTLAHQIYGGDRICFNFGRELYVYAFRGVKKVC